MPLELWLIVEENFDKFYNTGLCGVVHYIFMEGLISTSEERFLYNCIYAYSYERWGFEKFYFWKPHQPKPRKLFIQKQILKYIRA